MSIFVDAQEKWAISFFAVDIVLNGYFRVLADMLAPHRKGKAVKSQVRPSLEAVPTTPNHDGTEASPMTVLPSSTELFYFYGQSLEQCSKLSTGQALFNLSSLHKKWLRIYAEDVLTTQSKRPQPRKSTETRLDLDSLRQSCLIINTADYCQTTALELEEKIRGKVNDDYKDKISFQAERDLFISAISTAIGALVREVEATCDPAFQTMARTTWSNVSQVSGQSPYAGELVTATGQVVEALKPLVEQKKYLRNFLDKACNFILVKFTNCLVKSRPLKEIGAEQLLIDLQTVKAYLSKMPGDELLTTNYTKSLTKTTTRLEALLKVIVTPVDPPEGFILNYTLLIGDASFSNFQKILDLKGTPKPIQHNLLDSFLTITSTKTDLENTSFLSSLDMDPPASGVSGASLVSPVGTSRSTQGTSGESIFGSLGAPPYSGPPTGSSLGDGTARGGEKREVFSDFRRFVSFGLRKDTMGPSS